MIGVLDDVVFFIDDTDTNHPALAHRLHELDLKTVDLHWGVAHKGDLWLEHSGVIVTAAAMRSGIDFVSRFFAPRQGIPEDPVTGSAHCALGPFWAERLDRTRLERFSEQPPGRAVFLGTPSVASKAAEQASRFAPVAHLMGQSVAEELLQPKLRRWSHPLDYLVWVTLFSAWPFPMLAWVAKRPAFKLFWREQWKLGLAVGFCVLFSYALVLWGMQLGSIAEAAALREISVILVVLFGMRYLKEPFGRPRL